MIYMEHPHNDKQLAAIVGRRPGSDYIWCEECLRWENLNFTNHPRPKVTAAAQRWFVIGSWLLRLASRCNRRGMLLQAAHLVRIGEGKSDP